MATESFIEVNFMLLWSLGNGLKSKVVLVVFGHFEYILKFYFFSFDFCSCLLYQPKPIDMITWKMVYHEERDRERAKSRTYVILAN